MSRVLQIFRPSKIDFRSASAIFLVIRNDFSCGAGGRVRQVFWSRVTLSQRIMVAALVWCRVVRLQSMYLAVKLRVVCLRLARLLSIARTAPSNDSEPD
ncbi:MAG: hypothetical protein ACR2N1_03765 [Rubripirellula sp.]